MTPEEIEMLANKLADILEKRQAIRAEVYMDLLWNSPIKTSDKRIEEMKGKTYHQLLKEMNKEKQIMTIRKFRHKEGFLSTLHHIECTPGENVCICVNAFGETLPNYFYTLEYCLEMVAKGCWVEVVDE